MFVRPTWAEIDLDHIAHNIRSIQQIVPAGTQLLAVVKANAYGHGAVPVARKALESGATYLAVATVDEGIELRKAGIAAPILVMGYTPPDQSDLVVRYDLTQTVFQVELLQRLSEAAALHGKTVKVHLKVDTGMGRLGLVDPDETVRFAKQVTQTPGVCLEGVYTHFATADEADARYAEEQIKRWETLQKMLKDAGLDSLLLHISNSAGILQYPVCAGQMVRLGISMYGYYPSSEVQKKIELRQALRLVSKIAYLKQVPSGTKISYGGTFETRRESLIATLPIGYADGYARALSNRGQVLVRGMRVPVVGRVCMDQIMIDVTDVPHVALQDEVVLYGNQGAEFISVDEVADQIGTISYEVCCAIGRRVPRCYLESGQTVLVQNMLLS